MKLAMTEDRPPLLAEIEVRVRRTAYGRVRDLDVVEDGGRVVVRGRCHSHHSRQLALHALLEVLSGDRLTACLTVS